MLDSHLAKLYGVEPRALVQAVKRNIERFPKDFMFQLTMEEARRSRSQSVILNAQAPETMSFSARRGANIKYRPFAFTEQGVAMLSSVLHSPRAVQVNIEIMRAFVRLRQMLRGNAELSRRLDELEETYDGQFRIVFDAIRELRAPTVSPKKRIGFDRE